MNLPPEKIPQHIAIIMDGNGRWAENRGHPRVFGHVRGASRVRDIVRECGELGVKALTLYAFSTENWSRPAAEVGVLWKILTRYLRSETEELNRQNVSLNLIGDVWRLDPSVLEVAQKSIDRLKKNTGLKLNLALSYGSRQELLAASQRFAQDCLEKKHSPSDLNDTLFNSYLFTHHLGKYSDVDLVIRTSGEIRVSNFLLWQSAYAEFVFLDEYWPDFEVLSLHRAIENFASRNRRFGKVEVKP